MYFRRFGSDLERGEFVDSARVMSRREYLKKREDMMLDLRGRQLRDKEAILAGEKSPRPDFLTHGPVYHMAPEAPE